MAHPTADQIGHDPDSYHHFDVLGVPRRLVVDQGQLSDHYYRLSRVYHPDFHQSASPSERLTSLQRTAAVNRAYTTLRDPVARGKWWVERQGGSLGDDMQIPNDLLGMIFGVREQLDGAAESAAVQQVREQRTLVELAVEARVERLSDNFAQWDALPEGAPGDGLLAELKPILAGISYLRTLLKDIDRALEAMISR